MEIFKNPVLIGFIIAVLVYGYLVWSGRKNKSPEKINLLIPLVAGVCGWLVSYCIICYLEKEQAPPVTVQVATQPVNTQPMQISQQALQQPVTQQPVAQQFGGLVVNPQMTNTNNVIRPDATMVMTNGLTVPTTLKIPEVFIDTY